METFIFQLFYVSILHIFCCCHFCINYSLEPTKNFHRALSRMSKQCQPNQRKNLSKYSSTVFEKTNEMVQLKLHILTKPWNLALKITFVWKFWAAVLIEAVECPLSKLWLGYSFVLIFIIYNCLKGSNCRGIKF